MILIFKYNILFFNKFVWKIINYNFITKRVRYIVYNIKQVNFKILYSKIFLYNHTTFMKLIKLYI